MNTMSNDTNDMFRKDLKNTVSKLKSIASENKSLIPCITASSNKMKPKIKQRG